MNKPYAEDAEQGMVDEDNNSEHDDPAAASSDATTGTTTDKPSYNLRLRGYNLSNGLTSAVTANNAGVIPAFGSANNINSAKMNGFSFDNIGSTSASHVDRQYWAPTKQRDPLYFEAKLNYLKLMRREFGDHIAYPAEYADALGLPSSRDACVATEFPDGDEEVKEDNLQMWYVERIIAHKKEGHGLKYLVKWRGWPNSCNSWEPSEKVFAPEQIVEYFARYGAKAPRSLGTVCFDQEGKIKKYDKIKGADLVVPVPKTARR